MSTAISRRTRQLYGQRRGTAQQLPPSWSTWSTCSVSTYTCARSNDWPEMMMMMNDARCAAAIVAAAAADNDDDADAAYSV